MLREARVNQVVIEQVSAMPKQGVASTFRFGYACGAIYGAVVALGLPGTSSPRSAGNNTTGSAAARTMPCARSCNSIQRCSNS